MEQRQFSKTWIIVFAAITVIGIGLWIYQLVQGPYLTGVSNTSIWGINIIMFMFFVGLSAGGLIVASSGHVFGIEKFKKIALPAVIVSTVSIILAVMYILVDVGSIRNIWRIFTGPNFISPLLWDVTVISLYLIINILDIVWISRGEEKKVKVLSYFALPTAILVHSVTAWIFGLQIGRTWYTAIMGPIFVASACDSGLSLLLLALIALEARRMFDTGRDLFKMLSKLLAVFVAVDAYLLCCELLTMGYPSGTDASVLSIMTSGATAPYFWFEIICGLLIPFLILVVPKNRERKGLIAVAASLIILGVLAKRVWLLLTAFVAPAATNSAFASDALAANAFAFGKVGAFYAPTAIEVVIAIAILCCGVLAFMLISNALIAQNKKKQVSEDIAQPQEA